MKKTYLKPQMEEIELCYNNRLLAGSGVGNGDTIGQEYNPGDISYGRKFELDFDEEDY